MRLFLRWNGHLKKHVFFISYSSLREDLGTTCKICVRKYASGTIISSRIYFTENYDYPLNGWFRTLNNAYKAVFPIPVMEKTIVLDRAHIDFTRLSKQNLFKGLIALFNETRDMRSMGFNRIICTFQSRLFREGTPSHPQIRVFALKIPKKLDLAEELTYRDNLDVLLRTDYHSLVIPFIRINPLEILILSSELSYMTDSLYKNKEKLKDLVKALSVATSFLHDIPFVGVINFINENFYVRIINSDKMEILWPILAFRIAGLNIVASDLDEIDSFLNAMKKGGVGGNIG